MGLCVSVCLFCGLCVWIDSQRSNASMLLYISQAPPLASARSSLSIDLITLTHSLSCHNPDKHKQPAVLSPASGATVTSRSTVTTSCVALVSLPGMLSPRDPLAHALVAFFQAAADNNQYPHRRAQKIGLGKHLCYPDLDLHPDLELDSNPLPWHAHPLLGFLRPHLQQKPASRSKGLDCVMLGLGNETRTTHLPSQIPPVLSFCM